METKDPGDEKIKSQKNRQAGEPAGGSDGRAGGEGSGWGTAWLTPLANRRIPPGKSSLEWGQTAAVRALVGPPRGRPFREGAGSVNATGRRKSDRAPGQVRFLPLSVKRRPATNGSPVRRSPVWNRFAKGSPAPGARWQRVHRW